MSAVSWAEELPTVPEGHPVVRVGDLLQAAEPLQPEVERPDPAKEEVTETGGGHGTGDNTGLTCGLNSGDQFPEVVLEVLGVAVGDVV